MIVEKRKLKKIINSDNCEKEEACWLKKRETEHSESWREYRSTCIDSRFSNPNAATETWLTQMILPFIIPITQLEVREWRKKLKVHYWKQFTWTSLFRPIELFRRWIEKRQYLNGVQFYTRRSIKHVLLLLRNTIFYSFSNYLESFLKSKNRT